MPSTLTFDSLQEDVRKYLERGSSLAADPTVFSQIPRLINLAERTIARELKVQGFINVVSGVLIKGESVVQKPDRWRDTISINIGTGPNNARRKTVSTRDYEYVRTYWPDESLEGEPLFYADYEYGHWLIAPTPDAEYPFEVKYYELPALLDEETQTNWLTDYAPQMLLFATLVQAEIFLKNDERVALMQQQYDRAAAMLNGEDLAKILDGSAARTEA